MLQLGELRNEFNKLLEFIEELRNIIRVNELKDHLVKFEQLTFEKNFWNDKLKSQEILQKIKILKLKTSNFLKLEEKTDDLKVIFEIANEEDEALLDEINNEIKLLKKLVNTFRLETLLNGPYDNNNAILTFHAGAGGIDAQDWVEMLFRMYSMWCKDHNFKMQILNYLPGDECGIKTVSMLINGENAYGLLKSEMGVHRLVRISPFDSSGKRHTSFASLEVIPEIDNTVDIKLNEAELKIDTYRANGAGGQHINKTESAVRITHLKTGIVVTCQNERSQHQNKEIAIKILISKLIEIKEKEQLEHIEDIKGIQQEIAWGSQIRSYIFMPYTLVKDHRTGYETGNISAIMNGNLDEFIMKYLSKKSI